MKLRRGFLFGLVAVNLGVLAFLFAGKRVELPVLGQVRPFSLVEKSGAAWDFERLKGHPWVASFMFTRCGGQCPAMNAKLSAMQSTLPGAAHLVSFSVDPGNDTPETLRSYAEGFRPGDRWIFLTGEKKDIDAVLTDFHVNNSDDPGLHSLRLALVDAKGAIRGYYDSTEEEAMRHLARDIMGLV